MPCSHNPTTPTRNNHASDPPTKTYPNLAEGQRVAKIMAERNPGQVFNLCRLVEKHKFIKPVPVKAGHTVEKL